MSTLIVPLQKSLSYAFSQLQIWFDPAQSGSPYEAPHMPTKSNQKKKFPLFSKRLSIRI